MLPLQVEKLGNTSVSKSQKFRRIFLTESVDDFSRLYQHADQVVVLRNSVNHVIPELVDIVEELYAKLVEYEFDPGMDAIVPARTCLTSFLTGFIMSKFIHERPIHLGVYRDKEYTFWTVG